ncbi:hypothetical protein [Kiloniella sp.]|uniref:hypothetical protein n=1 Tax=Kiloniella sp. TaxID=1938587 RepID=UPI003A939528
MDTVKEIFADSPFELEVVTYPWSRSIHMAFTPDLEKRAFVLKAMEYFDQKMRKLVQAGRVPEIMKSYGLPDWNDALPSAF